MSRLSVQAPPVVLSIAETAHFGCALHPHMAVLHGPEKSDVPVGHATRGKVVGELLQVLADVGQRVPLLHMWRFVGVLEGVRTADSRC